MIRINKATRELNVGVSTLVEFLHKKGFADITEDLNQKLTDEQYNLLVAEYSQDKMIRDMATKYMQEKASETAILLKSTDDKNVELKDKTMDHVEKVGIVMPEEPVVKIKIISKTITNMADNTNNGNEKKNETGYIGKYIRNDKYGFINVDGGESVYFNAQDVGHELMELLNTDSYDDEPIVFDLMPSSKFPSKNQAFNINIDRSKRRLGYVVIHKNGDGEPISKVKDIENGLEYYLFTDNLKNPTSSFINFEDREDDPVIFSVDDSSDSAKNFELIDKRRYFLSFAAFPCADQEKGYKDALKKLVEDFCSNENWDYIHNKKNDIPVLVSYMNQTCKRIVETNRYITASKNGVDYLYFNTGLADKFQDDIYAYFVKNEKYVANQGWGIKTPEWFFLEFNTSKSKYRRYFSEDAEIASYFEPGVKLVLEPDELKKVLPNYDHIKERKFRIDEKEIKEMEEGDFRLAIKDSIDIAYKMLKRNYKTAIPQFYSNEIQFLIPLYSRKNRSKVLAAMVVRKNEKIFEISTILTVDQAYNNARLLAKPDREWLNP